MNAFNFTGFPDTPHPIHDEPAALNRVSITGSVYSAKCSIAKPICCFNSLKEVSVRVTVE